MDVICLLLSNVQEINHNQIGYRINKIEKTSNIMTMLIIVFRYIFFTNTMIKNSLKH